MQNTTHAKLDAIRSDIKRWRSRLLRAMNRLSHLEAQEKYWQKKLTTPAKPKPVVTETTPLPELDVYFQEAAAQVDQAKQVEPVRALDIPLELRRPKEAKLPKTGDPGPKLLEDLLNPAAVMNRKRLERLDAKRRGYKLPVVDKKAMPLSGKAASEAIRKARKKD